MHKLIYYKGKNISLKHPAEKYPQIVDDDRWLDFWPNTAECLLP